MPGARLLTRLVPLGLLCTVAALACREEAAKAPEESASRAVLAASAESDFANLLLITLDTTRADALGAYGQRLPTTPALDRLAARGVLFEQAMSSHPETLPSHATIFTGKWPYGHGVRSNAGYLLSERHVTLAEVFGRLGYRTGAEIAAPVLRKQTGITQGFQHYRDVDSPGADRKLVRYTRGEVREKEHEIRTAKNITDRGIDFLRENRRSKFFLWLHYFDAHSPHSAPASFNIKIPESPYHAEVASQDHEIGRLLRELDRLGLRGRTLVVVTADHGEGLHEHGEPSHSFYLYETTLRVPLVLAGLGLPAGIRIPSLVRTADIAPTVLALMGLPSLAGVQGVSLVPLLSGEEADLALPGYGESTRFTATLGIPPLRTLRQGRWKYIHKVNPELYDVIADPGELANRAKASPEIVGRLRADLELLLASAPPAPEDARAALDARTAEQLIALGYVAKSPVLSIRDDRASLVLRGRDPMLLGEDIKMISQAEGYLSHGDYQTAIENIEILRERNPDSTFLMGMQAEALAGLERNPEAIALLRKILADEPGNKQASYDLALTLRADGQGNAAADLLSTLLLDDPCDGRLLLDQNELLKELGRYAELVGVLEAGAENCPEMLDNLNNFAWALATLPEDELRDGPRAAEIMRKLLAGRVAPAPAHRDTLAAALAESGDPAGAIREGRRGLEDARAAGGSDEVLAVLEQHLEAFRAHRPLRDPAPEAP
jgi:arylsulfatase A-like enzyme